jgi:hypothetical protein
MFRFFGFLKVKGDGTELFVRAFSKEIDIDAVKQIIGLDKKIEYKIRPNYCFLSFKDSTSATHALENIRKSGIYKARYAYIKKSSQS